MFDLFLNPWMLGGALFIGVPIVLHLVMRQQPKHFVFPAVRFIKLREQSNRHKLQFRHLLLLVMRCLAIMLLAAALARPSVPPEVGNTVLAALAVGALLLVVALAIAMAWFYQASRFAFTTLGVVAMALLISGGVLLFRWWNHADRAAAGGQEAPVAAAFVIDTSPRMQYRQSKETRLEAAQDLAAWLLPLLPANSDIAVLDSTANTGGFVADRRAAQQRVERLALTMAAQPLPQVIEEALRRLDESQQTRKELYIFTDLARSAWSATAAGRLRDRLKELKDVGVYIIDVGALEPQDFALGDPRLSGQVIAKNSPFRVDTELTHIGIGGERTIEVWLPGPNGVPERRGEETIEAHQGEAQTISFQLAGLDVGTHQGFVRIKGDDTDGLAVDDVRYFTIEVRPPWKVLVAAPKPAAEYALLLTQALAPESFRRTGRARFTCDVMSLDQLTNRSFDEYAAVCLLDPTPMPPAVWQQLRVFAQRGGGIAIFLGHNAQPVETFNDPAALEVLPGPLLPFPPRDHDVFLAPENLEHPALANFKGQQSDVPWNQFPVFQYWRLGNLAAGTNVVIPYSNRRPALVERNLDRGHVLTMTTPISDAATDPRLWNTLATGDNPWPFVKLVNEMMLYLVGNERLNYAVGQRAELKLPAVNAPSTLQLVTPRGDNIQRSPDLKEGTVDVTATDMPGQYLVTAGGETGFRRGFSVNLPPEATQLERLNKKDLDELFSGLKYRLARGREEIDRDVSLGRVGWELFPFLILTAALLLAGEHFLASRFYGRDVKGPREKVRMNEPGAMGKQSLPV